MQPIVATDITQRFGAFTVLDGISLTVPPGARVGLVGENGTGKSTLIRILAGIDTPYAGRVNRPAGLGYLSQRPEFAAAATVGGVLDAALEELHEGLADLDALGARLADATGDETVAEQYAARLAWAERHEAWDTDRRAAMAAERLGLQVARERRVDTLSGGQQVRLALACLIARRPECVILDEPTNHLDDGAMALLADFLRGLPGPVLVASHDRTFLDEVCTTIVDLDPNPIGVDGAGGNTFTGGFSDYLAAKRSARARWEETYAAQQEELRRLRRDVATTARAVGHAGQQEPRDSDKYARYVMAQKKDSAISRRVRAAEQRLADAEAAQVRKPRGTLRFAMPDVAPGAARTEVSARDLVLRGHIRIPHLGVATGDHLLVSGENGCGKSSLLRAIAGRLAPTSGELSAPTAGVGFLPQDVTFADPARTARAEFAAATGTDPASLTELGLVHPRDLGRAVGELSVGTQRRLALAAIVASRPRLLLLDEPTNHISLLLATELEEALAATTATVIIASHDRWLRRRWSGTELPL